MNRVGLIGWPVAHSLSPKMHNAAFEALGLSDWHYDAMAIPPDVLRYGILEPQRHGYIGINVTIPHKQAVMEFCTPDEKARAIGAVNTIDLRSGEGTNTDVDGFIDDLSAHAFKLDQERILVLGAGGAARAALYGLAQAGADVAVHNRTASKAEEMVRQLTKSAGLAAIPVMDISTALAWKPSLIVNCTSAGMDPDIQSLPYPEDISLPEGVDVYDMVYRPAQTLFMQKALAGGGRAVNGLGMLARQGARAFTLWTGYEAPIEVMLQVLEDALYSSSANAE
ncbi:shikimate dehydrogenase [Anaerolineales bacterium]